MKSKRQKYVFVGVQFPGSIFPDHTAHVHRQTEDLDGMRSVLFIILVFCLFIKQEQDFMQEIAFGIALFGDSPQIKHALFCHYS